jgi:hypothetical protein
MPEQPVDLGAVARDDALLDALGRGTPPPDDDFAAMLASWRTDLSTDAHTADIDAAAEDADEEMAGPLPVQKPAHGRLTRVVLAAAAAVLALAGTIAVAAGSAQPGSRLWPITTVVYAERADSLVAAQETRNAIAEAREAVAAGRYAEAGHLLDQATALAGGVRDTGTRQQLLDEVAAVRALRQAGTPTSTTSRAPTPTPSPSPSTGASPGSHTGGGNTGKGKSGSTPSPSASSGGGLTGILPSLPLPTLTLKPLPTLPG